MFHYFSYVFTNVSLLLHAGENPATGVHSVCLSLPALFLIFILRAGVDLKPLSRGKLGAVDRNLMSEVNFNYRKVLN